jgi:hypothetical protein
MAALADKGKTKQNESDHSNEEVHDEDFGDDEEQNGDLGDDEDESPPTPTHIILMGDSVLDDFYWLKDKALDVRQQIEDLYNDEVTVTNLAVDESTSSDVLNGMRPSSVYVNDRRNKKLPPYPVDKKRNGKVFPLRIIKRMLESGEMSTEIAGNEIKPTVVLSIGGNDVRAMLSNVNQQAIVDGMKQLEMNAEKIIHKLLTMQMHVIMVICYEPHHEFASGYGLQRDQLLQIMNIGVCNILLLAEKYGLPVIDLSRTFNPFDRSHYGSTVIEPSNKSGQFIADLVQCVFNYFPFNSKKPSSKIYHGTTTSKAGIVEQRNNKMARKTYLQEMMARAPSNL